MKTYEDYPIEDKVEYIIALVNEFGTAHGMKDDEAWRVLRQHGCVDLIEKTYGFLHTQSFPYVVNVLDDYIQRKDGEI
jgi:hypothetical protein